MSTCAERIQELRAILGKTQTQMAEEVGVFAPTLNMVVHDKRRPTIELLIAIAMRYGTSVDWLLGLSEVQTLETDRDDVYRHGWRVGFDSCCADLMAYLNERKDFHDQRR